MFIFKIVMIGLKELLHQKNKGRKTVHHQQLVLSAFSELSWGELRNHRIVRVEGVSGGHLVQLQGNGCLRRKVAFWIN